MCSSCGQNVDQQKMSNHVLFGGQEHQWSKEGAKI